MSALVIEVAEPPDHLRARWGGREREKLGAELLRRAALLVIDSASHLVGLRRQAREPVAGLLDPINL